MAKDETPSATSDAKDKPAPKTARDAKAQAIQLDTITVESKTARPPAHGSGRGAGRSASRRAHS